jgi:hypothetical protein
MGGVNVYKIVSYAPKNVNNKQINSFTVSSFVLMLTYLAIVIVKYLSRPCEYFTPEIKE